MDSNRPAPRNSVERTQSMDMAGKESGFRGMFGGWKNNTETVDPDENPTVEGWLVKERRGVIGTKWQRRYFALYGIRLVYWVEEVDFRRGMPFKGSVELAGCSIVSNQPSRNGREFCFGLFHPLRKEWWLGTRDMPELVRWVQKIEEALGLRIGDNIYITDFDMLSVVGRGASGMVYQVKKRDSGEVYAMKVISKTHIKNKLSGELKQLDKSANRGGGQRTDENGEISKHWMVQSVRMERTILEVVDHPFIVRLFFAFQTPDKLCFVTDFVNGGELYSHISKAKTFTEDRARFYAGEIILALEYLHEMGIVYRDLKPENILLDREGHVKLTDFGQSKTDMRLDDNNEGNASHRRSFSFVGSPYYMAPEIFLKQGHGIEADWWSLGILIYEMICGLPPFYSDCTTKAYRRLLTDPIEYPPHVSEEARKLLRGLLHVDLTRRFGSRDAPRDSCQTDVERISTKWSFAWFVPINWAQLLNKQVKAPFTPNVSGAGDLSNISSQFTSEVIKSTEGDRVLQDAPEDPFVKLFDDFSFNAHTMEEKFGHAAAASSLAFRRSPASSPSLRGSPSRPSPASPSRKSPSYNGQVGSTQFEKLVFTTGVAAGGTIKEEQAGTIPCVSLEEIAVVQCERHPSCRPPPGLSAGLLSACLVFHTPKTEVSCFSLQGEVPRVSHSKDGCLLFLTPRRDASCFLLQGGCLVFPASRAVRRPLGGRGGLCRDPASRGCLQACGLNALPHPQGQVGSTQFE
eukprot:CAMPEP_0173469804 /NCGR_PEP_ID=MMETSP1357-20121228/77552_1 /TAXON_ID=77926 /ORGANISM="Hemiselmis rufescens, Strain PCC563" /LENGTH=743 /DNA_ID=CAMNT_0014438057 /DNA_START=90 /DNA_END=2318 /DNA_ORIENTATION=+